MTMFEFMMNALYGLAGVACIAIALMIAWGVLISIYNAVQRAARENERNKQQQRKERGDIYGKGKS